MAYRIASVSFLNAVPLVDWFEDGGRGRAVLSRALPSRIAAVLAADEADVGLLPVVEIFRGAGGSVVPGTGIACRGAVDSVKMFHRGDPSDLRRVLVDRGSRTSVALLRILLAEMHGAAPEFEEVEPVSGWTPGPNEGALVIGDRCFEIEKGLAGSAAGALDLGEAWTRLTGLPFVFAMWVLAPAFEARAGDDAARELAALLGTARDHGLDRLDDLARREASLGRPGVGGEATPEALTYYFRQSLRFVVGDEEMAGLRRFHELCVAHRLVSDKAFPPILPR